MSETIRVRYDELNQIAGCFTSQADQLETSMEKVRSNLADLASGGFKGKAAHAFYQEMDCDILPALKRLDAALRDASTVLGQAQTFFQEAEQEGCNVIGQSALEAGVAGMTSASTAS